MEVIEEILKEKGLLLLELNALGIVISMVLEVALEQVRPLFRLVIAAQVKVPDNILAVVPELDQDVGKETTILPPIRTLFEGDTLTIMVLEVLTVLGEKLMLQPVLPNFYLSKSQKRIVLE